MSMRADLPRAPDIVGKRYWYFAFSALVMLPGLAFIVLNVAEGKPALPYALDFTGGSLLEVRFEDPSAVSADAIREVYAGLGIGEVLVNTAMEPGSKETRHLIRSEAIEVEAPAPAGGGELTVATQPVPATAVVTGTAASVTGTVTSDSTTQPPTEAAAGTSPAEEDRGTLLSQLEDRLSERIGAHEIVRFETVGPSVGAEVRRNAGLAVGMASIGILLYLALAFRHVPNPLRYGSAAIVALLHDVTVVVGLSALMGRLAGWQVDALFLTALLTVIGYSVHDSIVVFDRIRENMSRYKGAPFAEVVNHSILQTLDRSINTQLTVVFTLVALIFFGGSTIRHFVSWLLIGVISGTYSSIFNASPLLVAWEYGELSRPFRRLTGGRGRA
jgi:preprotein translocase subunit SecF